MISKSKMYCSVPQCSNYISKTVSMHKFPTDVKLSKQWQIALKIGKPISKFMYVCSEHFLPSDYFPSAITPQRRRLKKCAIPSQKIPHISHETLHSKSRSTRKKKLMEDEMVIEEMDQAVDQTEHEIVDPFQFQPSTSRDVFKKKASTYGSYGQFKKPITLEEVKMFEDKGVQTDFTEFLLLDLLDTDMKLKAFTNVDHSLLTSMETTCKNVAQHNSYDAANLKMKILLVLIKLKLNISFVCLAILFNLSASTCTSYFYNILELLSTTLKPTIYWPTRDEVRANLPKCFEKFRTTRVVLDCTEVAVQKCSCLTCRIKTYSHYKSTHTIKWLVGITPSGLISYISAGYGGRASDKSIVVKENLIEKCEPGTAIMVDKGFLIERECEEMFIKLIRPPFIRQNKQLSKEDAEMTADIARARVHVERAIQRIKSYKIVNDKIPWYLIPSMDAIMTVVVALVNLSPPILSDDKFEW